MSVGDGPHADSEERSRLLPGRFRVLAAPALPDTKHAQRQRCSVYANYLNPAAVDYLRHNAVANGVVDRVQAFNMDGGEFLREQVM